MDKYFEYLIRLRDSGVTNMWGAPEYLVKEFGLNSDEADRIFLAWKQTFNK